MARDFTLDAQAAKDANSGGKRIKETGRYNGTIKAAWYECNDRGTESVQFLFESDDGQEAGPLALYTHNGDGKELPSYKTLNAIMTCVKARTLSAKPGPVELYDFDAGGTVQKTKDVYPELTGKPVGLVLQQEEYTNRNGELKERMIILAPFEAGTGRMAAEVLAQKTEAHAIDGIMSWLEKHPVKGAKGARTPAASTPSPQSSSTFEDDDIPF